MDDYLNRVTHWIRYTDQEEIFIAQMFCKVLYFKFLLLVAPPEVANSLWIQNLLAKIPEYLERFVDPFTELKELT